MTAGTQHARPTARRSFVKEGLCPDPADAAWMSQKACHLLDAEDFDAAPHEGEQPAQFRQRIDSVDLLCNSTCAVKDRCFEYGVRHDLAGVMFAGLATKEKLAKRVVETPEGEVTIKELVFVDLAELRYHGTGPATIRPIITASSALDATERREGAASSAA
jgi:hypothetical protein